MSTSRGASATVATQRYGAPRPWVRWLTVITVVALGLSGSGWLVWAALYNATPQVASRLISFTVSGQHRVDVVVQVDRSEPVEATCRLTAQSIDRGVVGQSTFLVPADGASSVTLNRTVRTERRAAAVVLDGCTTAEQPQPR